jgi:adenylate kinase
MENEETLVYRLRKRAEIRRNITSRKSVQENKPDKLADLLEEAANEIEESANEIVLMDQLIDRLDRRLEEYDI